MNLIARIVLMVAGLVLAIWLIGWVARKVLLP